MATDTSGNSPEFALSIRQPFAELTMLGIKTVEYRSRPTRKRGRIWIYASLGRWPAGEEARLAAMYGLDVEGLPRGVLVGTVELWGCDGEPGTRRFAWMLREARPSESGSIRPVSQAMPVWFRPFSPG